MVREIGIFLVSFFIVAGISIYGYILAKNTYGGGRSINEYIVYSAHITDYLFPNGNQSSLVYKSSLLKKWERLDHHSIGEKAAFIGFVPTILIFFYAFKIVRSKDRFVLYLRLTKPIFYLTLVILLGFILSLGPRLNANGNYLHIPLPYDLIIKFVPLITSLRALARWFFLVVFATTLFIGIGLDRLFSQVHKSLRINSSILGLVIFGLFFWEFYPSPLPSYKQNWLDSSYIFMRNNLCSKKPALLEYPFIYRNLDASGIKDLQYKTKIMLDSTQHDCKILSGWPSYEPEEFQRISYQLDENGIDLQDLTLIKSMGFDYLKLNKFALTTDEVKVLTKFLSSMRTQLVYRDDRVDIYDLRAFQAR